MKILLTGLANIYKVFGQQSLGSALIIKLPTCIHIEGNLKFCYISGLLEALYQALISERSISEVLLCAKLGKFPRTRKEYYEIFEKTFMFSKDTDLKMAIGFAPALLLFAWYLKKKHGCLPKDLWDLRIILATGVPYIHDFYKAPLLKAYGDQAAIIELYGATEALVAMQIDEQPYITPFYNLYFLEIITEKEVKMLHELKEGELGTLIISTPILSRYNLGDLIECIEERRYFKVHGRSRFRTRLRVKTERLFKKIANCVLEIL